MTELDRRFDELCDRANRLDARLDAAADRNAALRKVEAAREAYEKARAKHGGDSRHPEVRKLEEAYKKAGEEYDRATGR
jgi:hypothetical protein